ncbi:MAG: PQQ-dependent sugar dehydrogenase [Burkholderiales bacterium]
MQFAMLVWALLATALSATAQTVKTERTTVRVVTVASGLENPWSLAFLPDGRTLVTERPGRMRVINRDGTLGAPIANMPAVVARGQGGLLDVVLDPQFATTRTIYFCFSEAGSGGVGSAIARGRLTDISVEDVRVIFRQLPKAGGGLHFGCRIVPAPDGTLFVTVGERGERDRAQDLGTHFGKVVRINPDGTVPADNPFVNKAGARPEIWSYGHRNPQGAALHPQTRRLWVHEHGAQGGDEINIPEAGKNYGWPVITHGIDYSGLPIGEGRAKAGMEQPIYFWDPSIAPSGMAFYTGDVFPEWRGNLFVGALRGQLLARLELDGNKVVREERILRDLGERIRDVRSGPDGFLYLLTDDSRGKLIRLERAP